METRHLYRVFTGPSFAVQSLPSVPSLTLPLPLPFTSSFPSYTSFRKSSLPYALSIPPSLFFFLSQISLRLFPLFLLLTPPPFPCTYFLPTISLSPFLLHPYTSPPPPKNKSNSHKRLSLSPFWEQGIFFRVILINLLFCKTFHNLFHFLLVGFYLCSVHIGVLYYRTLNVRVYVWLK